MPLKANLLAGQVEELCLAVLCFDVTTKKSESIDHLSSVWGSQALTHPTFADIKISSVPPQCHTGTFGESKRNHSCRLCRFQTRFLLVFSEHKRCLLGGLFGKFKHHFYSHIQAKANNRWEVEKNTPSAAASNATFDFRFPNNKSASRQ